MKELLRLARELSADDVGARGLAAVSELEQEFVEAVTFAPAEEIVSMLNTVRAENWIGLPVWARNLAFRLACLQRPDDVALLRDAAGDLLNFGPDWDEVAAALLERAGQLEERGRE